MEHLNLCEPRGAGVGLVVEGADKVDLESGEDGPGDGGNGAPLASVAACPGRAGDDAYDDEVGDVGPEYAGQGVVEVAPGLVRVAEGAVGEDIRAELEVEETALEVDELGSESLVRRGEGIVRADGSDAVEEGVGGDLEAAFGQGEEVLRAEVGEGLDEVDDG